MLETDELVRDDFVGKGTDQVSDLVNPLTVDSGNAFVSGATKQPQILFSNEQKEQLAKHQEHLDAVLPAIYNNPTASNTALNIDFNGLQHGTFIQAVNKNNHLTNASNISRPQLNAPVSMVNYRTQTDFVGYGQLQNTADQAKSIEIVYTLPQFEPHQDSECRVVLDSQRINEFDGLTFKNEDDEVVPGFDITYSYEGHAGEYSTIDTLKHRKDFSWDKVISVMIFGVLEAHSSCYIDFPFKILNGNRSLRKPFSLNEYALYDLETNERVTSRLNFYVSRPVLGMIGNEELKYNAIEQQEDGNYRVVTTLADAMPSLNQSSVIINNFNNGDEQSERVLWQGGKYSFDLSAIQHNISAHGYTIDVDQTGQSLEKSGLLQSEVPFVRVHQVLKTQDIDLKAGVSDKWDYQSSIVAVRGLDAQNHPYAVPMNEVFIVDDTNLDLSVAGNYPVKVGYHLNGSNKSDMLITQIVNVRVVENKQTVNVYYIELPLGYNANQPLRPADGKLMAEQTQTFTGFGDTTYENNLWGTSAGYQIIYADQGAKAGKFIGGQPAVDYYVYLAHQQQKVTEHHTVKRTITVKMANEPLQIITQQGTIQRTGVYDEVTKQKKWQEWTKASLPAFVPAEINGYKINQVAKMPITLQSSDIEATINYQPQETSVTIDFVDQQSGAKVYSQTLTGLVGESIDYSLEKDIAKLKGQGYVVVKNTLPVNMQFSADRQQYVINITANQLKKQQVTITYFDTTDGQPLKDHTQHLAVEQGSKYHNKLWDYQTVGYRLVKADQGATEGQYFAGSDSQRYWVYLEHQTTPLKKQQQVKRTINITMPDQTVQTITQTAIIKREGKHDLVTGQDNWLAWQNGQLPTYIPEPIDGYRIETVPVIEVSASTKDIELQLQYQADLAQVKVEFVNNGQVLFCKTLTGATGQPIPYHPAKQLSIFTKEGYQVVENTFPKDGLFAAGTHKYEIKLQKLIPVQPQNSSIIEKAKDTNDKKSIFATLKGLF